MTTLTKSILALVGAVIVGGFIWGAYQYPKASTQVAAGASPAGTTFSTAKFFGVAIAPAAPGTNATSSSVQNNTGQDLGIVSTRAFCEGLGTAKTAYSGAGLAALTVTIATSSTAAPAINANTNTVGSTAMTLATSTGNFTEASSTSSNGATSPGSTLVSNIWAAGSFLSFYVNATSTGTCTIGVEAIPS